MCVLGNGVTQISKADTEEAVFVRLIAKKKKKARIELVKHESRQTFITEF